MISHKGAFKHSSDVMKFVITFCLLLDKRFINASHVGKDVGFSNARYK